MAPVTPSPHRFLPGQRRQPSPSKSANPSSVLRPRVEAQAVQRPASPPRASTASQFAATPRFSTGKPRPNVLRAPSPSKPALVDALRATARPREDVEEVPLDDADEEMLDNEQIDAVPTTEDLDLAEPGATRTLPLSPKRRRVEGDQQDREAGDGFSPARPAFKHPQTPASHLRNTIPRFTHPRSSIASTLDEAASQHRPAFLRPSAAPPEPSVPLPEAFSPHRRGQKFVPGGMAATVQQWAIETGQAARQGRQAQAYLRGEDYAMRVKVQAVEGDGPYLVMAKTANGEDVHVLLAKNGATYEDKISGVVAGSMVGVRAPMWEVESEGRVWKVGADWRVL